jgi:hypothetical protein
MRRFAVAAVLAGVGLVAFASSADAQVVIGTRPAYAPGTVVSPYGVISPPAPVITDASMSGYYSPYPGYMYSPFANSGLPGGYSYSPYYGYGGAYTYRPRYYTSPPGGVLYGRSYYPRFYRY